MTSSERRRRRRLSHAPGSFSRLRPWPCSISDPYEQALALARVAGALAGGGLHERADALAEKAETVARSITVAEFQAQALARVAGALAGGGG